MNAQLTFVHALSPLHAGTGQGAGVIDLPIAREKATGIPFLPGSSLKGALSTRCFTESSENEEEKKVWTDIFGPKSVASAMESSASMVQFSDQRLLLLPVRSLSGTFAWVTSPYILRRLLRDLFDIGIEPSATIPDVRELNDCFISDGECALMLGEKSNVYLEDLDLQAKRSGEVALWADRIGQYLFPESDDAWRSILNARFCLVHDNVLGFLLDTATEIITRIRLNEDSKTVETGGLWYEEALPTETILSGLVLVTPWKNSKLKAEDALTRLNNLTQRTLQLGGKATVGRGMCRVYLAGGKQQNADS
jgi:CRISPR-associated protein Cmr4